MQKQDKRNYEAPQLTAVSFKMEKGFAGSNAFTLGLGGQNDLSEYYGDNSIEDRTFGGNWGGSTEWH